MSETTSKSHFFKKKIADLTKAIQQKNQILIVELEDYLKENIEDIAYINEFYQLPLFYLLQIIQKVDFSEVEECYDILCSENGAAKILKLYDDRLCCKNETVEVYTASEHYNAICKGVNNAGNLIVEKENGLTTILQAGEIRIKV